VPLLRWHTLGVVLVLAVLLAGLFAAWLSAPANRSLVAGDNKPGADVRVKQVASADWPLFRGNPLQTGVATSGLPEKLEVLWQFKTGDAIEGTAAIVDGVVYIGSLDERLYAIDLATGKQKWKYKAGPIKAAIAARDGAVYVGNLDGVFHCVDAAKGTKRWTYKVESEADIPSGANFVGDSVLFGCGDEHLYCLSNDGKLRWKFKVPGGPVNASPGVVGDRTFVAGCDSSLHMIDTKNGKELAAVDLGGQVGAPVGIKGNQLYVGTMTNQVLAIDWQKADIVWKFEPRRARAFYAGVAVTDDFVIAGSKNKRVYAVDRKKGTEVWSFPTDGDVDSSPVVVGKRVFVGSHDGNLYALDLNMGTLIQKLPLGGRIIGSPAVGGNCLIISATVPQPDNKPDIGVVYCLGAKK